MERGTKWIHGPGTDVAVAFAWVPFFAVSTLLDGDALVTWTTLVLAFSFAHQPLTFPLVYGDADQFRLRRLLYLVAPPVAVLVILIGLHVSLLLVAVVAATWNAIHTMRQRYGLVRIYGRKVGQGDGRYEQTMLFGAFLVSLAIAAAQGSVTSRLGSLPLGRVNSQIVRTVDDIRFLAGGLAAVVAVITVVALVRWVALERQRPRNPAKHVYLLGAAALFVALPFDPVAGLLGFAGAHAVEYAVVVHANVGSRYGRPGTALGSAISARPGRAGFLAAYIGVVLVAVYGLRQILPTDLYISVYFAIGALHFLYDGLIWRTRQPEAKPALVPAA